MLNAVDTKMEPVPSDEAIGDSVGELINALTSEQQYCRFPSFWAHRVSYRCKRILFMRMHACMNICIPQRSHSAQACTRRSKQWLCGVYTRISLVSSTSLKSREPTRCPPSFKFLQPKLKASNTTNFRFSLKKTTF